MTKREFLDLCKKYKIKLEDLPAFWGPMKLDKKRFEQFCKDIHAIKKDEVEEIDLYIDAYNIFKQGASTPSREYTILAGKINEVIKVLNKKP